MRIKTLLTSLSIVVCLPALSAELHVPGDVPSIQAALDSIAEGDTVTVALGDYPGGIVAPPFPFLLRGDVAVDTGDYPRPVLDASQTEWHPEDTFCLRLTGSNPVVEKFRFVSRLDSCPFSVAGGVEADQYNGEIRDCVFDSTCWGLTGQGHVTLSHCVFRDNTRGCVGFYPGGRLNADSCLFSGTGFQLVWVDDSSSFTDCVFRDNTSGHLLNLHGTGHQLESCTFSNYGPFAFAPISGSNVGAMFIGCLFANMQLGINVIGISRDCNERFVVRDCRFEDITVTIGQGCAGIGYGCSENDPGIPAEISNNVFINCTASGPGSPKCIGTFQSGCIIDSCRFQDVHPQSNATINAFSPVVLRDNLFFNTGYALACQSADARWNWWGDSTGPYHSELNPQGMGDRITGSAEIAPWYVDTLFTESSVDEHAELSQDFSLAVYPNPFNSTTRLKLYAADATIISIELFDILGRRAAKVWSGPVYHDQAVVVNAEDLPSGIYFVQVMDVVNSRLMAKQKLVLLK